MIRGTNCWVEESGLDSRLVLRLRMRGVILNLPCTISWYSVPIIKRERKIGRGSRMGEWQQKEISAVMWLWPWPGRESLEFGTSKDDHESLCNFVLTFIRLIFIVNHCVYQRNRLSVLVVGTIALTDHYMTTIALDTALLFYIALTRE